LVKKSVYPYETGLEEIPELKTSETEES